MNYMLKFAPLLPLMNSIPIPLLTLCFVHFFLFKHLVQAPQINKLMLFLFIHFLILLYIFIYFHLWDKVYMGCQVVVVCLFVFYFFCLFVTRPNQVAYDRQPPFELKPLFKAHTKTGFEKGSNMQLRMIVTSSCILFSSQLQLCWHYLFCGVLFFLFV